MVRSAGRLQQLPLHPTRGSDESEGGELGSVNDDDNENIDVVRRYRSIHHFCRPDHTVSRRYEGDTGVPSCIASGTISAISLDSTFRNLGINGFALRHCVLQESSLARKRKRKREESPLLGLRGHL